jgi:hypothetical protein
MTAIVVLMVMAIVVDVYWRMVVAVELAPGGGVFVVGVNGHGVGGGRSRRRPPRQVESADRGGIFVRKVVNERTLMGRHQVDRYAHLFHCYYGL